MSQRILVINPNSSVSVTQAIDDALAPLRFADGPEIACATLEEGPPGVETQAQVDGITEPLLRRIRREEPRTDAFVLACFSDPGLFAAREACARPVYGIGQCAYLTALSLGERFGIVAILPASVRRHRRYLAALGLERHLAGELPIGMGVVELTQEARVLERLVTVGERLRDGHGAEVVILGCAGMARYRRRVQDALDVPVIDPTQAAVAMALSNLRLGYAG